MTLVLRLSSSSLISFAIRTIGILEDSLWLWSRRLAHSGVAVFVLAICISARAQAPGWVWMGGNSTGGVGTYSTLGVPSPGNIPGARSQANQWTDNSGNLWIYGGFGWDSYPDGFEGTLNDLWEFNPGTREWTWVGGSIPAPNPDGCSDCNLPAVYGTLGVFAPENQPGGRVSSATWTDRNGNLWLFGGQSLIYEGIDEYYVEWNDLWEFDPSTREWAWMGGSTASNWSGCHSSYGTMRVPDKGNMPGERFYATSWTDLNGNFWLFGGDGCALDKTGGALNDLWEFNPSTLEWTWVSGDDVTPSDGIAPGIYGTLGVPLPEDAPEGRYSPNSWVDASGNLWLFGGTVGNLFLNGVLSSGDLSDLWEFDTATLKWAWMGGTSTWNQRGVYGAPGVAGAKGIPGARYSSISWVDPNGHFWLFSGNGYDSVGTYGGLNDLWEFDPSTKQWTWMGGNATIPATNPCCAWPPVYGALGVANPANSPGERIFSVAGTDKNGILWLFSGSEANDLWAYGVQTAAPVLSLAAGTYTSTQSLTITEPTSGATIYYTTDGSIPTVNSTPYSGAIPVNKTTTITANAVLPGQIVSPPVPATYTVNLAIPVVTWPTPAPVPYGTALGAGQLDATASVSGSFVYSPPAGTVMPAGPQTLSLTFLPTDSHDYASVKATAYLTVTQAPQTITFSPLVGNVTYGSAPITLSATASSGLPVSFAVLSGPASISGSKLTFTGAGPVVIAASQPGNSDYLAAPQVTGTVIVSKAEQVISLAPLPSSVAYGVRPLALSATTTSGLPVTFSVISGPGLISGPELAVTGAGTIVIAANQSGNSDYLAGQVTQTITVSKAVLDVVANNQTRIYGAKLSDLTYSIRGFVDGETAAAVFQGAPVVRTAATTESPIGKYPITIALGTLSSTNYSFRFVDGWLTVEKARLTVTADSYTIRRGQAIPTLGYKISGFVKGDTRRSATSGAPYLATAATSTSKPKSYPIVVSLGGLKAENYSFEFVNGTLTVLP
jgi:N-acetylneuraminic acid mutarotase